jgi:hypothetical protein
MGNRFRALHLSFFLGAMLCGCASCTQPVPIQPTDNSADANVAPTGTDQALYGRMSDVGQACSILRWLKCPEGEPDGSTCEASMKQLTEIGTFERKNVLCIRQSRTVEKVRTCAVECNATD